jgi:hypothetical protein
MHIGVSTLIEGNRSAVNAELEHAAVVMVLELHFWILREMLQRSSILLTNLLTSFPSFVPSLLTNISSQSALVCGFAAIFDVIGLIASVITIAQVVTKSVEHAKTFYRAHEEFEALQASNTIRAPMTSLSP